MIIFIDLHILNHPCIWGINPTWSWCTIFLMYCWIWFASILLRFFSFMFIMDLAYHFEWNHQLVFMVRQVTGCAPLLRRSLAWWPGYAGPVGLQAMLCSWVWDHSWVLRFPKVTVQSSWLCGVRGWAQQLDTAAGLTPCLNRAVVWTLQLLRFHSWPSWMLRNEGNGEQEGTDDDLLSCPGCMVKQAL